MSWLFLKIITITTTKRTLFGLLSLHNNFGLYKLVQGQNEIVKRKERDNRVSRSSSFINQKKHIIIITECAVPHLYTFVPFESGSLSVHTQMPLILIIVRRLALIKLMLSHFLLSEEPNPDNVVLLHSKQNEQHKANIY